MQQGGRQLAWDACFNVQDVGGYRLLMTRYTDLPMDFADATVVELAERLGADTVFTLDERDFRAYRPQHVPHFRLLPADL